jgi:CheY-like chemotaxis protein
VAGGAVTPPCRLLLIEDDHAEAIAIERACCPEPSNVTFDVVSNGRDAEDALIAGEYDLIICDLALPADTRLFEPDTAEGLRLFQLIREQSEGTPVIVLSGHADLHMMQQFFRANRDADLYGTLTEQPLVQFFPKEDLPDCVDAVRSHIARTEILDQLHLEVPSGLDLSISDERALRIYGKRTGASRGIVERLGGGLSDATTVKLTLVDTAGNRTGVVVAKLAALGKAAQEAARYEQVAALLPVGLGAHVLYVIKAGAGRRGALIYQLADEHTSTLFDLLRDGDPRAVTATERLRDRLMDWVADAPEAERGLSEIRRPLITDLQLRIASEEIRDERDVTIIVRSSMSHGDLHGLNILVTADGQPTLIDYGEVRRANAALDPVTLELSAVFHPTMEGAFGGWPSEAQCRNWFDLNAYCQGSPIADFVSTCRSWATAVAAGEAEIRATAYAYGLRQMKYDNPSRRCAVALAEGAIDALRT